MLPDHAGVNHYEVLRRLHQALVPQRYLEIGTSMGHSLAVSRCASVAVDPAFEFRDPALFDAIMRKPSLHLMQMQSDAFFQQRDPEVLLAGKIDLAFLDGMHWCEFLLRDFMNTERYSRRGTLIVLHDCLPVEIAIAGRKFRTDVAVESRRGWWAGDVWKTALLLKRKRADLKIIAVDSFPTGLILITNLNPDDRILPNEYEQHVATMNSWDLEEIGLSRLFEEMDVRPTESLFDLLATMRASEAEASKVGGRGQDAFLSNMRK